MKKYSEKYREIMADIQSPAQEWIEWQGGRINRREETTSKKPGRNRHRASRALLFTLYCSLFTVYSLLFTPYSLLSSSDPLRHQ
jgi:hypothetical protein